LLKLAVHPSQANGIDQPNRGVKDRPSPGTGKLERQAVKEIIGRTASAAASIP